MRKFLYLFSVLLLLYSSKVSAQDIIVLKSGESTIRCNILSITDSLIVYQIWKSPDTTHFNVNPQDVLSFQLGKKSKSHDKVNDNGDPDVGLLEMYMMGKKVSGYVITASNDTVEGFIDVTDVIASQFRLEFTDSNGKKTTYLPGEVSGYGYNSIQYLSVKLSYLKPLHPVYQPHNGQIFMHRILDDQVKLFRVYKIEFNKGTMASMKYPPMYMGKLDHEFLIVNPSGLQTYSFGRTARATLNVAFSEYSGFIKIIDDEKSIHKNMIPDWASKFVYWYSENKKP